MMALVKPVCGSALIAAGWLTGCVPASERAPLGSETRLATVEEVVVTSHADGVDLKGDFRVPAGPRPAPAILLLGPTGPDDRHLSYGRLEPFRAVAEYLQGRGMAVLTLDDRGVGGSGGDWRLADYALLAADAASALEWLTEQPAVDGSRLGIHGLSEGGAIALTVAALRPEHVAFLILASPPGLPGERALEDQLERTMRAFGLAGATADSIRAAFRQFIALSRRASVDRGFLSELEAFLAGPGATLIPPYRFVPRDPAGRAVLFSSPWYQSQLDWDPRPLLPEVRAPTLVIGGALDRVLPPDVHHPPLADGLSAVETRFEVLSGLDHLLLPAVTGEASEYRALDRSADPGMLELVADWLVSLGVLSAT